MSIIGLWLVGAVVVGLMASDTGRSFPGYFLLALFLTPIAGHLFLALTGPGVRREPCWRCMEMVVIGALQCPYCSADLDFGGMTPEMGE